MFIFSQIWYFIMIKIIEKKNSKNNKTPAGELIITRKRHDRERVLNNSRKEMRWRDRERVLKGSRGGGDYKVKYLNTHNNTFINKLLKKNKNNKNNLLEKLYNQLIILLND